MVTRMQTYNNVSGQNQLSAEAAEFYQKAMLERLQEKVNYIHYGKKAPLPVHAGATTSWRRLEMPEAVTTAISEGTTPDGLDLSINKIQSTVAQYGAWTKISDLLDLTGVDPLLTEVAEMFGDHAAVSMEKVIATVLAGGTNVLYGNNKTSRATLAAGDVLSAGDIARARNIMVSNNVPMVKTPGGQMGYIAFTHPDNITRLMTEANGPWAQFNAGGDSRGLDNFQSGSAGQMYGIHFVETTNVPAFTNAGSGNNLSGKSTIIIGADAFGVPDVAGSSKPEILVFSDGSTENPMALYKTVAWKTCFAAVRLEEKRILRLESLDK